MATTARREALGIDGRRELLRDSIRNIGYLPGLWARIGRCLDEAHAVFTLSRVEEECLRRETGWQGRNSVRVPNGAPERPIPELGWESRSSELICIGRIEPRKRQLELARIARDRGIRIKFLGGLNSDVPRYGQEFEAVVSSTQGLSWRGQCSAEEVGRELGSSRILVNASWAEVQSLVDLEAIANGCLVYCCLTGSTYEHSPHSTWVYGIHDLELLLVSAWETSRLDQSPHRVDPVEYRWTWMDAASALSDEYERLQ